MNWQYSWLVTLLAISSTLAQGADGPTAEPKVVEPYSMYIAVPQAFVRCGPSEEYYRTDSMEPGDVVDVYVETEDGWLGIRPPDTSFCWLPEAHVTVSKDGKTAVVEHPKAVAWVGTNLGTAKKYRWQIRLTPGEQLAVLGATDRETATGETETWLKIVPPAGEFRWIHLRDVARTPDAASQRIAKIMESQREEPASSLAENEQAAPAEQVAASAEANPVQQASFAAPVGTGTVEPVRHTTPAEVAMNSEVQLRSIDGADSDVSATEDALPREVTPDDLTPRELALDSQQDWQQAQRKLTASSTPVLNSEELQKADLDELQLMLAQQIAASAAADGVEPIRQRALKYIDQATDAVDRGRARLLVERAARYQEVARARHSPGRSTVGTSSGRVGEEDVRNPTASYDQVGYLVQVYSARPEAPPFAITDRTGRTLAYIAPAPGVNLRRYLNQEVGLYGRAGYLTGLDTPYLMAERVVKLSDVRR